jgi:triosephosphate isomerase (TIM)
MTVRKLISVTDIEIARERGARTLEIPEGSIVTPLARDAARRTGLALVPGRKAGRRAAIFGNWKAHGTKAQAVALARSVAEGWIGAGAAAGPRNADLALFPPFPHIALVADAVAGTPIAVGAQDLSEFPQGAYTGGVTAEMVKDLGCKYVLVGHSERRREFGDDGATVARKLRRALEVGLEPVLCVGETLAERDAARTHAVLRSQLGDALDGVEAARAARIVLAYEPVWAIGTGVTPTPAEAEDALSALRDHLARKYGDDLAGEVRLLYGGSVAGANAARLLALPSCDGALVGGASLKPAEFLTIAAAAK